MRSFTRAVLVIATAVLPVTGCDDSTGPLRPTAFAAVATGARHTCALSAEGDAYCWGLGEAGELGDGTFRTTVAPQQVGGGVTFESLSAGFRHTCAVTADRDLWCWGWNVHGQLGNGTTIGQGLPIPIAPNLRVQQVAAGWFHTCALTLAADAFCWGMNGQGQLGDGTLADRMSPVRVAGNVKFRWLSAGGFHTCGVSTSGVPYCWGLNHHGQLGTGDDTNASTPRRVDTPASFDRVSAGYAHSCGIDTGGKPYCWGGNTAGELGVGFASGFGVPGTNSPAEVLNAQGAYSSIEAGLEFTCGTLTNGIGWCWGAGQEGQLGTGAYISWTVAQPVADVRDFAAIDAGAAAHACGITAANAVVCWGQGDVGQLGVPSVLASATPVRVPGVSR
jgi:alpha-tubulin suppressor-like RCC1 family protein